MVNQFEGFPSQQKSLNAEPLRLAGPFQLPNRVGPVVSSKEDNRRRECSKYNVLEMRYLHVEKMGENRRKFSHFLTPIS